VGGGRSMMHVNTKMIPVETVPRIRGGEKGKAVEVGNSSMIYLIHCKNLCKYYNVLTPSTTIKIKIKEFGHLFTFFACSRMQKESIFKLFVLITSSSMW
jgi:hypothetical protein